MEVCKYNDSKEPFFQDQRGDEMQARGKKKKGRATTNTQLGKIRVSPKGLWDGDLPGGPGVGVRLSRGGDYREAVTMEAVVKPAGCCRAAVLLQRCVTLWLLYPALFIWAGR